MQQWFWTQEFNKFYWFDFTKSVMVLPLTEATVCLLLLFHFLNGLSLSEWVVFSGKIFSQDRATTLNIMTLRKTVINTTLSQKDTRSWGCYTKCLFFVMQIIAASPKTFFLLHFFSLFLIRHLKSVFLYELWFLQPPRTSVAHSKDGATTLSSTTFCMTTLGMMGLIGTLLLCRLSLYWVSSFRVWWRLKNSSNIVREKCALAVETFLQHHYSTWCLQSSLR